MKCHYVYDKEIGKVLIPGCWAVVLSNDIRDCTCKNNQPSETDEIKKLKNEIRLLKKQINELKNNNDSRHGK